MVILLHPNMYNFNGKWKSFLKRKYGFHIPMIIKRLIVFPKITPGNPQIWPPIKATTI